MPRGLTMTQLWAIVVPAAAFLFVLSRQIGFTDLGYHLRAGEWMWEHGRLLDKDVFSSTFLGQEWLNQNWLTQLFLYKIWQVGGNEALLLVNALAYGGGCLLIYRLCAKRADDSRVVGIAFVVALLPSTFNSGVRPQAFSWLFVAILLTLLDASKEAPRRAYWIVPLMALWANVHGAFSVGLIFLSIGAFVAVVDALRGTGSKRHARILVSVTGLSLIAILANPWGYRVYGYVLTIADNPIIRGSIEEWRPPELTTVAGALFFGSVIAVVAALALSPVRLRSADLFRLGATFLLGLLAIRNGLWWTMAAAPAMATLLAPFGGRRSADPPRVGHYLVPVLLAGLALSISPWLRERTPFLPPESRSLVAKTTPLDAAGYLTTHELPGKMFNAQPLGSYLQWAAPASPTFIDSRIEMFSDELWSDYTSVINARPGWKAIARERGIGHIVIRRRTDTALRDALDSSREWRRVLTGPVSLIYVHVEEA